MNSKILIKMIQRLINIITKKNIEVDGVLGPITQGVFDEVVTTDESEEYGKINEINEPQIIEDSSVIFKEPSSPHFQLEEYYSNRYDANGKKHYKVDKPTKIFYPDIQLSMDRLELLRSAAGDRPVTISSAWRSKKYEQYRIDHDKTKTKNSPHKRGTATDIQVDGLTPKQVYDIADRLYPDGGVGLYDWGVHVDLDKVVERPFRW